MMKNVDVSVVIPCYNSEKTIREVVDLSKNELEKMGYSCEFILINDCSKDGTFGIIKQMALDFHYIRAIDLAKNFGQHNAIMAGFPFASGKYVLGMDDDLQTHPSQFAKLFNKMKEGYDLVYGYYSSKKENPFRRFGSFINNVTLGKMIRQPKKIKTSSFWLAKSYVIKEAIKYEHSHANLRGLFFRTTAYIGCTEVEHFKRKYGKSNYTFRALIRLWSGCINFSIIPLRIFLVIGTLSSTFGIIGAIVLIIRKMMNVNMSMGWPSLMVTILFFSGIILIGIGLAGEYIGRTFLCINSTPQYVIREMINENNNETNKIDK